MCKVYAELTFKGKRVCYSFNNEDDMLDAMNRVDKCRESFNRPNKYDDDIDMTTDVTLQPLESKPFLDEVIHIPIVDVWFIPTHEENYYYVEKGHHEQVFDRPDLNQKSDKYTDNMLKQLIKDFKVAYRLTRERSDTFSLGQIQAIYASHEWDAMYDACNADGYMPFRGYHVMFKRVFDQEDYDNDKASGDLVEREWYHMYVRRNPDWPNAMTLRQDLNYAIRWMEAKYKSKNYSKEFTSLISDVYDSQSFCMLTQPMLRNAERYKDDPPYEVRLEHSKRKEVPRK